MGKQTIKIIPAEENRRIEQMKQIGHEQGVAAYHSERKRTDDRGDLHTAQYEFRRIAVVIRKFFETKWPDVMIAFPKLATFRGAFDEIFMTNIVLKWKKKQLGHNNADVIDFRDHLLELQAADIAMEYEATANDIAQPKTFYACWPDEIPLENPEEYPVIDITAYEAYVEEYNRRYGELIANL